MEKIDFQICDYIFNISYKIMMNEFKISRPAYIFLLFMNFGMYICTAQDLRCSYCNKPVSDGYIQVEDKYFHPEHFLCEFCGEPINGRYTKRDEKFYHLSCARENLLPKCDVCSGILEGEYFQDLYGYKYHAYHINDMKRCDNCDKIICNNITDGGVKLSDGRNICNICYKHCGLFQGRKKCC